MKALLDACSIINLVNAGVLATACSLRKVEWWVPPIVEAEVDGTCRDAVAEVRRTQRLFAVDDTGVDAELYLKLLDEHGLGAGETECMAVALVEGHSICCDDRRARRVAETLLGPDRVFGTVRLLRCCVQEELIACAQARALLLDMRQRGGFLPDTPQTFFCRG